MGVGARGNSDIYSSNNLIFDIMQSSTTPKPRWLKTKPPSGENYKRLKVLSSELGLHTVCEEAKCPNIAECWGGGTATFMLMGDRCTRGCRFCAVESGNPKKALDVLEPMKIGMALERLGLSYVVLTSVDRDDLEDGGAGHIARTIQEAKRRNPGLLIEVLTPDFQGNEKSIRVVTEAGPDVFSHNLETVKRLQSTVRDPRAGYQQSLEVLRTVKRCNHKIYTKSSLMLGLGETKGEIIEALNDMREAKVDFVTLGQYLRPTPWHLRVDEFIIPEMFEDLKKIGESMGFLYVAAGPLVRTSYRAGEFFLENLVRTRVNDSN